jgi:hypothetical protein
VILYEVETISFLDLVDSGRRGGRVEDESLKF